MLRKVLVANRGEIACRVLKACKALGISTVAIFSEADRESLHTDLADEAFCVGPAKASESYLNLEKIIQIALDHGVDGIHPGYGFLTENAKFAQECEGVGIKFIGPSSRALLTMGNKANARQLAKSMGVPTIPGSETSVGYEEAIDIAKKIGFPVMLKPVMGGGGIGMLSAYNETEIQEKLQQSMTLAGASFNDPTVYIEKLIDKPRHIEVQILGDHQGTIIHLFERECSIQRRHQKLIEETPLQQIDSDLRSQMCHEAILVAQACRYTNAGTVEFLLTPEGDHAFMEMNTRLQVEHPVTEMTTGVDIVQLQIGIASGEEIPYTQAGIKQKGHAIECRIYAEDPEMDFFPSFGRLNKLVVPRGKNVRVDIGYLEGDEIKFYYDPLIGKLITWGETRTEAIERMKEALKEFQIEGVKTTIPLFIKIMNNEHFQKSEVDTQFLSRDFGL